MFEYLDIVIKKNLENKHWSVLLESIFVGFYSLFIFCICSIYSTNLFIVGFLKHLLGYFFLYNIYCVYGNACRSVPQTFATDNPYILLESIGEGILYASIGYILVPKLNKILCYKLNIYQIVFLIGFGLHIVFELTGIHKMYCSRICK